MKLAILVKRLSANHLLVLTKLNNVKKKQMTNSITASHNKLNLISQSRLKTDKTEQEERNA